MLSASYNFAACLWRATVVNHFSIRIRQVSSIAQICVSSRGLCMLVQRHSAAIARPACVNSALTIPCRTYAKGGKGDKGKDGKKQQGVKVVVSAEEMSKVVDIEKMKQQMELALTQQKNDYLTHLSLRTNTGSLDKLPVDTKDGRFPLMQLGQVTAKNPQLLIVNMASMPQYISEVKDAIMKSGMNLNPQQEGTALFVPIPMVTREHREQLAKSAKSMSDKTKEKIRDLYGRFERDVRKAKDKSSADRIRDIEQQLLAIQRDYMQQAEKLYEAKKAELLGNTKS